MMKLPPLSPFVKASLRMRHFRFVAVVGTGWHVFVVSRSMGNYVFTLLCLTGFIFASRLDNCVLGIAAKTFHWFVVIGIEFLIGLNIAVDRGLAEILSGQLSMHFSHTAAGALVAAILLTCEVLGLIYNAAKERQALYDRYHSVPPGGTVTVPVPIYEGQVVQTTVKSFSPTAKFTAEMAEEFYRNRQSLETLGGRATGEFAVETGIAYLLLANHEPKSTLLLHVQVCRTSKNYYPNGVLPTPVSQTHGQRLTGSARCAQLPDAGHTGRGSGV